MSEIRLYGRYLVLLFLAGSASAKLMKCQNSGTVCSRNVCANDGLCCIYAKPKPGSIRCFCRPGYAGDTCNITLDDGDWNTKAQEDLKNTLNNAKNTNVAKNIILFIGDGLGFSTITASRVYMGQQQGKSGEESQFEFEHFPSTGVIKTYNVNRQVPDSAGTASSIMTGEKVNYGTVGVNQNVIRFDCEAAAGNHLDTIFKWAQDAGKRTGIVSNTRITHATPAAAYANAAARYWECDGDFKEWIDDVKKYNCTDIALQAVTKPTATNLNVLMGGGRSKFIPNTVADPEYPTKKGSRLDGRNLPQEWLKTHTNNGKMASYVWNKAEFDAIDDQKVDHVLGLFEPSHMRYNYDNPKDGAGEPKLTEMVEKAIKILDRGDEGFLLLVEAGRIDHGHHEGIARKALDETVQLDKAIKKTLSMVSTGDSLVVVTADHSHMFNMGGYVNRGNPIFGLVTTHDLEPATDDMYRTTLIYGDGPGGPIKIGRHDPENDTFDSWDYHQQAAIPTAEETHGGEDVGVFATGPMAHLLTGTHEQNYIAHALSYAACIGRNKDHCKNRPTPTPAPVPCDAQIIQLNHGLLIILLITAKFVFTH